MLTIETFTNGQVFNDKRQLHDNTPESQLFHQYILPWAQQLPKTVSGQVEIADIAGGQGIEANLLERNGMPTTVIDASNLYLENSFHPRRLVRRVDNLPTDKIYSGALLKDALVFLTPEMRRKMLTQLKQILVNDGSLLVISENNFALEFLVKLVDSNTPYRAKYQRPEDWVRWQELFYEVSDDPTSCERDLRVRDFKPVAAEEILGIRFPSSLDVVNQLADDHGFEFKEIAHVIGNHQLFKELRWYYSSFFVAQLTRS